MEEKLLLLTIFLLYSKSTFAIPLAEFYPFGLAAGDAVLNRTLDGSSPPITLPEPFMFFGNSYSVIHVNNNGNLSPGQVFSAFSPRTFPLANIRLIAVFWADADTRPDDSGEVWYRTSTSASLLERAEMDIKRAYQSIQDLDYLFIATWNRIGYHEFNTNKRNTFQCVLAVSENETYAIYLYGDGLIQWTTGEDDNGVNGLGGYPAIVGYNAGDEIISYSVPSSQTDDIIMIDSISNVGEAGKWVFQLDEDDVVYPTCDTFLALNLSPQLGSMLGGTLVTLRGPCFEQEDIVQCIFDGTSSPGVYVDRESIMCVSPAMSAIGNVQVTLRVTRGNEIILRSASFYSIPLLRAHGVDIQPPLIVDSRSQIKISWSPQNLLPPEHDPDSYRVDVYVYTYEYSKNRKWRQRSVNRNLPNNGGAVLKQINFSKLVKVVAIHVTASEVLSTSDPLAQIITSINEMSDSIPFPSRAGIWSGLLFSIENKRLATDEEAKALRNKKLNKLCSIWGNGQSRMLLAEKFTLLPACPPTQDRAELPNSGLEEARFDSVHYNTDYQTQWIEYFNQGASKCFTQATVTSGEPGQECCYDTSGNLLVEGAAGGSANRYAPVDFTTYHQHIQHDLIPRVFCSQMLMTYYMHRPSDDGSTYSPPPPACIYGDPHIITLDGLKYTFNGKGEYTLIETVDDLFTLQGRMVEVDPAPGQSFEAGSPATVFSAIVGKQNDSDTVQFTFSQPDGGINTTVNDVPVNFAMLTEQSFFNVVVMEKPNKTYAATFTSGAYIEVKSANGFISLLLVSLPVSFQGTTSGLMGSFNGDTQDDLVPKVENGTTGEPVSSNSSIEDIHNLFGVTWIIDNANGSLFSYNESRVESWAYFYDPDYTPAFAPTFDNPDLEAQANEICGDSLFCLFDIAATKRPEIGMTTAFNNEEFDMVVNMSQPVVCDPPCANGACVATDTCLCVQGYLGDTCTTPLLTECEENVCENGGTCQMLAGSFICTCPPHLIGGLCDLLPPPATVSDAVSHSALMAVPLNIHPEEFGFDDYNNLISLCYEIRGAPGQIANLVSTKCTSINARYVRLGDNSAQTTYGSIGIRTIDDNESCNNVRINRDCSVYYNRQSVSTNFTSSNVSVEIFADFVQVTVPNCDQEISVKIHCLSIDANPALNLTITRNFTGEEDTHGLIGQFWSAEISSQPYDSGDTTGLVPGYDPYLLHIRHPQTNNNDRTFVGALIPRLWNLHPGQCVYAGNSEGGSTGTGPTAPLDSVIQGEYRDYRVRGGLFGVEFQYSKFQKDMCS